MGMGRVGRGAYQYLQQEYGSKVVGVEEAEDRLPLCVAGKLQKDTPHL